MGAQFRFTKLIGAALLACGAMTAQADVVGSVTYGVDLSAGTSAADGFYGVLSGTDSKGINDLAVNWGGGWTLAAKDNTDGSTDVSSVIDGIRFTVNAGAQATSGTWTLTGTEPGVSLAAHPLHLDIVAVLKSSTQYALYYFQDVLFDGAVGGDWLSPSFNKQGNRQALSHMSLYVRPGTEGGGFSLPAGDLSTPTQSGQTAVPEPGSLALVALGLLGAFTITCRKQRRGTLVPIRLRK